MPNFEKRNQSHSIELIAMICNQKWFGPVGGGNPHWQKKQTPHSLDHHKPGRYKAISFHSHLGTQRKQGVIVDILIGSSLPGASQYRCYVASLRPSHSSVPRR